jgi:hypothetical protein
MLLNELQQQQTKVAAQAAINAALNARVGEQESAIRYLSRQGASDRQEVSELKNLEQELRAALL